MDGEIPWHTALLQNAEAVLLRQTPLECPALVADVQHQGKVVLQGEQDLRTKSCGLDVSVSKAPALTLYVQVRSQRLLDDSKLPC